MKIAVLGKEFDYISDDSREIDSHGAFLLTQLSSPYQADAQKKGCSVFLKPDELKELLPISIPIIGITGTNGKTTTAAAIYSILLDLGYRVALLGTRGFYINDEKVKPKGLTTPLLLEIYHDLLLAQEADCDFFVMEVSSHAIAQNRIESLEFALKILTNITSDHLDYHKHLAEYIRVKNSFFDDDSPKLINSDETHAQYRLSHTRTYGLENTATYKVIAYSLKDGITAQIQYGQTSWSLFSHLYGRHNLYNVLAAVAAVEILTQKPFEEILTALEGFGGVMGRMEQVSDDPLVIVDFAHTEDGMQQIFESFLHKKIVVLFGAGGDRDRHKRPRMGAVADKYAQKIYLTSDNPRSEEPLAIIEDILAGISDKNKCVIEPSRPLAIEKALQALGDNEVLLILGKGDECEQICKDARIPMNDAELVKGFLGR